jgi:structural maintenance of chromosome 1
VWLRRLERMEFIPLDSAAVKPVDERLRSLGGGAKLAIDLVDFDRKFERAYLYALGWVA